MFATQNKLGYWSVTRPFLLAKGRHTRLFGIVIERVFFTSLCTNYFSMCSAVLMHMQYSESACSVRTGYISSLEL